MKQRATRNKRTNFYLKMKLRKRNIDTATAPNLKKKKKSKLEKVLQYGNEIRAADTARAVQRRPLKRGRSLSPLNSSNSSLPKKPRTLSESSVYNNDRTNKTEPSTIRPLKRGRRSLSPSNSSGSSLRKKPRTLSETSEYNNDSTSGDLNVSPTPGPSNDEDLYVNPTPGPSSDLNANPTPGPSRPTSNLNNQVEKSASDLSKAVETADKYFAKDETVYRDEKIQIVLKKIKFARQERFHIDDHNFQLKVILKKGSSNQPLLRDVLDIFLKAIVQMLKHLQQFYPKEDETQIYLALSNSKMASSLNTGNYSLNTPPSMVANSLLSMLYNYLTSNKSMRLDETINIYCRTLSVQHANKKINEGTFNKHIYVAGNTSKNDSNNTALVQIPNTSKNEANDIKKKPKEKWLFRIPDDFTSTVLSAALYENKCLPLAFATAKYLSAKAIKENRDRDGKKRKKPACIISLKQREEYAIKRELMTLASAFPEILELDKLPLERYVQEFCIVRNCQAIVFSNVALGTIYYQWPPEYTDKKETIYLFLEEDTKHVNVIHDIDFFFKSFGAVCLACKKKFSYKHKSHMCPKLQTCKICMRVQASDETFYLKNKCRLPKTENIIVCDECNMTSKSSDCFVSHSKVCKKRYYCNKCNTTLHVRGSTNFKSQDVIKKKHVCYKQQFCFHCFQFFDKNETAENHYCRIEKAVFPQHYDQMGFFGLMFEENDKCEEDLKSNIAVLILEEEKREYFKTKIFSSISDIQEKQECHNFNCRYLPVRLKNLSLHTERKKKNYGQMPRLTKSTLEYNVNALLEKEDPCPITMMLKYLLSNKYFNYSIIVDQPEHLDAIAQTMFINGISPNVLKDGMTITLINLQEYGIRFFCRKSYMNGLPCNMPKDCNIPMQYAFFPQR